MKTFICLASMFGDEFNFGILDYRLNEKVIESYDLILSYGQ